MRALAHDLGRKLTCGAFLSQLTRTKSGPYTLEQCILSSDVADGRIEYTNHIRREYANNL